MRSKRDVFDTWLLSRRVRASQSVRSHAIETISFVRSKFHQCRSFSITCGYLTAGEKVPVVPEHALSTFNDFKY